jgi:hypothetical protein
LEQAIYVAFPCWHALAVVIDGQRQDDGRGFASVALGGDMPDGEDTAAAVVGFDPDADFSWLKVTIALRCEGSE